MALVPIVALLFTASVMVLLVSLLLTAVLHYYVKEVQWIEKESESLEAVSKDVDKLLKEVAEVEILVGRFWDSEVNLAGMHVQLSNNEKEWVKSAREVAGYAKDCVTTFKSLSQELFFTAFFRLVPIIDIVLQIKKMKREIIDKFNQKNIHVKGIYDSMERCRSKNRSLLDIYTIQENMSVPVVQQVQRESSTSIVDLIRRIKDLFSGMEEVIWPIYSLLLLHVFLIDMSQFLLKTETENTWVKQANELIAEAERSISTFRRRVSTFGNNIIVRNKFKRDMESISIAFDNLLVKKDKFNFEFIDRAEEKSIHFSTNQNTGDKTFISAINSIRSKVSEVEPIGKQGYEINSLCNMLENMYNKLYIREEATLRSVCLEQIKSIAQETDSVLENFIREPELKHLKEFKQIEQAITLVQKIIDVCYIKRQNSRSVVGLGMNVRELVSQLTTNGDNHSVLSIVGMMGVGKTTLAKEIYNNWTIINHFPIRAWLRMPFKNDEHRVLHCLKEKPSLLVLDNVSSTEEWDELKAALSDMMEESRILLTTRFEKVALHAGSTVHRLRLRTKGESWKLFQMVTSEPKLDPAADKLARKVVGICGGLPLSILSLGYLISANAVTYEQLLWALERINQGQNQTPWLLTWDMNNEGLSETLSKCLSYFTLFPRDFEIPARRLVNLWVAEGLEEQCDGLDDKKEALEDVAEKYLEELRDRNMIQAVELKSNGKIKTCRMPIMPRELILRNRNQSIRTQKQFAFPSEDDGGSPSQIPISFLFFDTREVNEPGEHIGSILSKDITNGKFMGLRVLDLERVFRPQLPKIIGKLIELRYLGLRWTYLETIPSFIGKLINLETLDIKHTCIRTLPDSIWRLKKLRNLYLNQSDRSKIDGNLSGDFPESLQTLSGVFIDERSPLCHGLHMLKNLRKLKLAFQLMRREQEALAKFIVQLNKLHSLTLRSIDEMGEPQNLRLNGMSKLHDLSSLYLFGNLEDRLRGHELPQNLTDLTLSASKLSHDPMPQLQKLPKLRSLSFYAESYTGTCMGCTTGNFPKLLVLRFWFLKDLEEWNVEQGAMPNLIELEFRSCSKLRVPSGLKHLKTLYKIKLPCMPEKFITTIERNKGTFWDNVEIVYD